MPNVLINIDVPDLAAAERFYTTALELRVGRRLGPGAIELLGAEAPIYLLEAPAGSRALPDAAAQDCRRDYARHWSPVHLDFLVANLDEAVARAEAAGARRERGIEVAAWGAIAGFADPFGHGFCLIELRGRGYDALVAAEPSPSKPT
jgi:catechol 2,3-dioxygenase-like lactoylglutathione lyase family enzyme